MTNPHRFDVLWMLTGGTIDHDHDESANENVILYLTFNGERRVWAVESTFQEAVDHTYGLIQRMLRRECHAPYIKELDDWFD